MNFLFVSRSRQRGLSLIELMIAMVLGLLLLGAVMQFYLGNKSSFTSQEQNGYLQESGRYALGFIARDARMAGLSGCSSRRAPDVPFLVINHLNITNHGYDLMAGVRGYEATGTAPSASYAIATTDPANSTDGSDWSPALPTGTNALSGLVVPGSDVLVVSMLGPSVPLVAPFTNGASFFVNSQTAVQQYEVAVVSNCQQAEIFQITNLNSAGATVVGSGNSSIVPGNASPVSNTGPTNNFRQGTELASLRTYVYFVGRSAANGRPSLFRSRLIVGTANDYTLAPEELINGVDSMQVTYGIDSDDNFVVDSYDAATATTDWSKVRAIRVALLVRSPDDYLSSPDSATYDVAGTTIDPVNDRRQRRVFESTIALRNRLL